MGNYIAFCFFKDSIAEISFQQQYFVKGERFGVFLGITDLRTEGKFYFEPTRDQYFETEYAVAQITVKF